MESTDLIFYMPWEKKGSKYPFFLLVLFSLFTTSCQTSAPHENSQPLKEWMETNGKIKVLSTTAMIEDIVRDIGGEWVDSIALIQGELDPHSYQLVKGDDEKLLFADLIFSNGLGLEHGPSLQYHLQTNPKAIALGNRVIENDPSLLLKVNGQMDPHIWMDISIWEKIVPFIVEAMSKQDPAHAEDFRRNGEQLEKQMADMHRTLREKLQAIPEPRRYLVTSHDAFNYFTRAYLATDEELKTNGWEKRFAAPEGLAPESQLSAHDIQHILNHLEKYHIEVIFPESNVSKDSIRKILSAGKEKGLNLVMAQEALYGDAMGSPGSDGDHYLKMLSHNANLISKYLTPTPQKADE